MGGLFISLSVVGSLLFVCCANAAVQTSLKLEPASPITSSPGPASPELDWETLKTQILDDHQTRISPEFRIDPALRKRVEFWFDIYTRYGEAHHIIHHVRYPWIVYRVVDTTELLTTGKGPTWLRRDRAQKFAAKQLREVRQAVVRLSRRKSFNNLPPLEREIFDKLSVLKGSRKSVLRMAAAGNVRSQLGQKDFFQRGLVDSSRYLPHMEQEFRDAGLPIELTRLPFVESSFNIRAYSKVGASGIWQIMPQTGRAFMLVNNTIDERQSPLKSTITASKLFKQNYRALKSWPLTLTSYNHGIGNIRTAIRRARSNDLATIIERYHRGHFKFASSNFYTCFLAALYAERYNELLFKDVPREPFKEVEIIRLAGRTRAKYLAQVTGLSKKDLVAYNLDLEKAFKRNSYIPKGFRLHLPPGYKDKILRQVGGDPPKSKRAKT